MRRPALNAAHATHPVERFPSRGLATSLRAEEDTDVLGADIETDLVERPFRPARTGQVLDLDQRSHRYSMRTRRRCGRLVHIGGAPFRNFDVLDESRGAVRPCHAALRRIDRIRLTMWFSQIFHIASVTPWPTAGTSVLAQGIVASDVGGFADDPDLPGKEHRVLGILIATERNDTDLGACFR